MKERFKKEGYILIEYEVNLFNSIIEYVKAVPRKHLEVLLDIIKPEYDKIKYKDYKYEIKVVNNND